VVAIGNKGIDGERRESKTTVRPVQTRRGIWIRYSNRPIKHYRITGLALFRHHRQRRVTLFGVVAEGAKGIDGEKAMDSRNATTTDDVSRIRSDKTPEALDAPFYRHHRLGYLFYLIRPLGSFSEQLFLQNDRNGRRGWSSNLW
jgi:hypothetical protein